MHHAAKIGHDKVIKSFLKNNKIIDKHPKNNSGDTPMHVAANEGHQNVVTTFLDNDSVKGMLLQKHCLIIKNFDIHRNN